MMRMWSVAVLSMCLGALMVPLFVWQLRRTQPVVIERRTVVAAAPVQVIDVGHGLLAIDVPTLLHLAPGEHIAEVDGAAVADEYGAWRAIVTGASDRPLYTAPTRAGRFVDLAVEDSSGIRRRVLLLLH